MVCSAVECEGLVTASEGDRAAPLRHTRRGQAVAKQPALARTESEKTIRILAAPTMHLEVTAPPSLLPSRRIGRDSCIEAEVSTIEPGATGLDDQ